ncbi:lytic transglycosylase domain-containing protein [Mesorhizobium sp. M2A.F.Ca.ET.037.01.1.1]|uniref:lytic transglycosylase domain-containing protein n=1 Tax=unclassified Mesorhizobium TaxID=325217 RepID=UPI000FCCD27C|nr:MULTISPECIES: lytic transglycosylase domain-containing protein [unclassified Mesorhizobium]RUX07311.1 lytic transglycosylase domain-containing protein [Mesorhizobium sp. M2A.F.Ca.ET.037.01.1.1]RWA91649.1 MAG: lytic transglycosylase domain-containing protein [Mesorhizobium sp.]
MDRVTLLMLGMIAVTPCACSASTGAEPVAISLSPQLGKWQQFVAEASQRFRVPESWIYAVMDAESSGRTVLDGRPITSRAGAMGLMQVMPKTYRDMRVEHGLGADPYNPRDNILAGTAYLRAMYDRFGFPGLFAAYNAGPERYDDHLQRGRPLPSETVDYLRKLTAAGVSAAEMDEFKAKFRGEKASKISSGRELFFLKNGVSASGSTGGILVPLGPEQAGSERPVSR